MRKWYGARSKCDRSWRAFLKKNRLPSLPLNDLVWCCSTAFYGVLGYSFPNLFSDLFPKSRGHMSAMGSTILALMSTGTLDIKIKLFPLHSCAKPRKENHHGSFENAPMPLDHCRNCLHLRVYRQGWVCAA